MAQRDKILMAIMGSGNDLEIDGIGGGNPLTSKVAIISRSSDPRADIRVRLLLYGGVERLSVCVDFPLQRQQFHLTGGPERAVQYARLHLGTDDGGLTGDRIAGGDYVCAFGTFY